MDNGLLIKKNIDVLIASYGGVGTSFLAEEVAKYAKVNHFEDEDGYKHLPFPPLSPNKNLKILYVIGDPIIATVSLFRRDYASYQSYKLNRYSNVKPMNPSLNIDEYAKLQEDKFNFKTVFENWNDSFQYYPTLIVKYSAIHDSLPEIKEFLNLPNDFITNFPKKIERNSKLTELSKNTQDSLHNMYVDFSTEINGLPPCYIKSKQSFRKYLRILFSLKYIKGYVLSLYGVSKSNIKTIFNKQ